LTAAVTDVFTAFLLIGVVLVLAKLIRRHVHVFRRLILPASVIGGVVALFIGPQVWGQLATTFDGSAFLTEGLILPSVQQVWSQLPVLAISAAVAASFH